jgi:hypothetical protein
MGDFVVYVRLIKPKSTYSHSDSQPYQIFQEVVSLGLSPLSLVRIVEELLE